MQWSLVLNLLAFGAMGGLMGSCGYGFDTWQYWAQIVLLLAINETAEHKGWWRAKLRFEQKSPVQLNPPSE